MIKVGRLNLLIFFEKFCLKVIGKYFSKYNKKSIRKHYQILNSRLILFVYKFFI
ncbi:MAG: hypothetical protein K0R54_627 [Clostridiaceae bacterium]|jgi:hypothetical protein|nr:hypothetical protein [Clostridiaceae bacterium]